MSIIQQLRRLDSMLGELATIDFGYPLGDNRIVPPSNGAAAALSQAGLAGIGGLSDLFSACDGIRMPDVHNGYFIYDHERVCLHYTDSDPNCIVLADNRETEVLTIGQDGGGNHLAVDRKRGRVFFLPMGPLHDGRYDGRHTNVRIVAEGIPQLLDKLVEDVAAFVRDEQGHRYLTDE